MVSLAGSGRELTIDADDARARRLAGTDGAPARSSSPNWTFMNGITTVCASGSRCKLFRNGDGDNLKDFAARADAASESRSLLALRVDYDLTATVARGCFERGRTGLGDAGVWQLRYQ